MDKKCNIDTGHKWAKGLGGGGGSPKCSVWSSYDSVIRMTLLSRENWCFLLVLGFVSLRWLSLLILSVNFTV